ncbi:hypothetical protein [Ammoniphilus sp. 3BR4]|uniref:hypothetical protein n=1 Tax=Ammoniphilus sp. 3BR4 TaxID=3158265 RepID=UPI0034655AF0
MESLDLSLYPEIHLPRFLKIQQNFSRERLEDITGEIQKNMAPYLHNVAGKRIALGLGSRGINRIAEIAKCVIDNLKQAGAIPFIIPVMGSHGGATPEGQADVLAAYGITPETMGVPIDASMDVEVIGEVEPGLVIGLGKQRGTDLVHRQGFGRFHDLIPKIGCLIAQKTKFLFSNNGEPSLSC